MNYFFFKKKINIFFTVEMMDAVFCEMYRSSTWGMYWRAAKIPGKEKRVKGS